MREQEIDTFSSRFLNDPHIPHVPNPTASERNGWKSIVERNLRG